ncbi:mediator of RNA polymerase II transcription subunit 15 [Drosophila rhopaloa]|uniref:Protein Mabiki n=1 Tax=Drosophila rhopaloa TaxID=1041015 RepID=A0ABM5GZQ5_DRORH|nr:mediator of RNA polymerase II transcription subunit 15 [Drosophila rhopaloa]
MDNYSHKKFTGALKRKRSQDGDSDDDVVFVMEQQPGQRTPEQPQAKRRFFRPWLDESAEKEQPQPPRKIAATPPQMDATYHANMVRNHHQRRHRSPKEQLRRDRNTLASLRHRRSQQQQQQIIEQEYLASRIQHEAKLQQQIRLSLYYVRFLQQTMASMEPLPPTQPKQMLPPQKTTTQHP